MEKEPKIADYIIGGYPERTDWNSITTMVEEERDMVMTFLKHCDEEHVLVGLGRYLADRLIAELREFEGTANMLFKKQAELPEVIDVEPMLNRCVKVTLSENFWCQDKFVFKFLLAKMIELGRTFGFKVTLPGDKREQYIFIKCEFNDLPL